MLKIFNTVIRSMHRRIHKLYIKFLWRKRNKHNFTRMENYFNINRVSVGKATYGKLKIVDCCPKENCLKIGSYCSIAEEVVFILGGEHPTNFLSTYPFINKIISPGQFEAKSKGNIVVEDDVWIGHRSIILSGVTIGQGAVVASGSVVTKNVPPYAIVAGSPAKILKYRFDSTIVEKLKNVNFDKLSYDQVVKNKDLLYKEIHAENIDFFINLLANCKD